MQLQVNEVSMLTHTLVSLINSKNTKKNLLFEQAINAIDDKYAHEVISTCLDNLLRIDDSLQQLFINQVLNQTNTKIKKVLIQVLIGQLESL